MKPVCCDTSFLFSLYGSDNHSVLASEQVRKMRQRLTIFPLNEFELENAFRLAAYRGFYSEAKTAGFLLDFQSDQKSGQLLLASCTMAEVVAEAKKLSTAHTVAGGHRAFDIIHVAAAVCCAAGQFLSFDVRQRELARSAKLKLNPMPVARK